MNGLWLLLVWTIPFFGGLWALIVLGCLAGDSDTNRFGPPVWNRLRSVSPPTTTESHDFVEDDQGRRLVGIPEDEMWQTFLEYGVAVREAVERLATLSPKNVEEFRQLLLAGRDRARVKEYEDESVRRVQGAAFVGDQVLQKAYVVLNSKDRRLGDELVRVTRVIGRPDDLEQVVKQILSNSVKLLWSTQEEPFEIFWSKYPSRGKYGNPKEPARRKFKIAVQSGTDPAVIIRGTEKYADYVAANDIEDWRVAQAGVWLEHKEYESWSDGQAAGPEGPHETIPEQGSPHNHL